jgi:hypothetical protein
MEMKLINAFEMTLVGGTKKSKSGMTTFSLQNSLNMITHLSSVAINLFHQQLLPGIDNNCSKLLNSAEAMCEMVEIVFEVKPDSIYWVKV